MEYPVYHLQSKDFDANGTLVVDGIKDAMVILIMIYANSCGHCKVSKPKFLQAAKLMEKSDRYVFATIAADGTQPGERELGRRLKEIIPDFFGFPTYVTFKKKGAGARYAKTYSGDRSAQSLIAFASTA